MIPSKFEAASGPLMEAFSAGVAAGCSNVTSLPEQAGDAALVFDPDSVDEIADAVMRLWTDEALRRELVRRGKARVSSLSWRTTALTFRAHYRRVAGIPLSEEETRLIGGNSRATA